MRHMYSTSILIISTLLGSLPSLHARPSFIDTRDAPGTDKDGATLNTCSISSSVNGEEGNMIMSSTVYKGDSSGAVIATLQTTFPDTFTTPGICWPSDDSNQAPFYIVSEKMKYGVITNMCTPGSNAGGFSYEYAGQSGSAAFEDQGQIESGLFQEDNPTTPWNFECWLWDT